MSDEQQGYADSYEDVSMYSLVDQREQTLLDTQTECCFMWTASNGDPVGVIMNFVARDGHFWLTCTRRRKRVKGRSRVPHPRESSREFRECSGCRCRREKKTP